MKRLFTSCLIIVSFFLSISIESFADEQEQKKDFSDCINFFSKTKAFNEKSSIKICYSLTNFQKVRRYLFDSIKENYATCGIVGIERGRSEELAFSLCLSDSAISFPIDFNNCIDVMQSRGISPFSSQNFCEYFLQNSNDTSMQAIEGYVNCGLIGRDRGRNINNSFSYCVRSKVGITEPVNFNICLDVMINNKGFKDSLSSIAISACDGYLLSNLQKNVQGFEGYASCAIKRFETYSYFISYKDQATQTCDNNCKNIYFKHAFSSCKNVRAITDSVSFNACLIERTLKLNPTNIFYDFLEKKAAEYCADPNIRLSETHDCYKELEPLIFCAASKESVYNFCSNNSAASYNYLGIAECLKSYRSGKNTNLKKCMRSFNTDLTTVVGCKNIKQ